MSVTCSNCQSILDEVKFNTGVFFNCRRCSTPLRVETFPALWRPQPVGQDGPSLQAPRTAGCYYHARKKASVVCTSCGRFLCALCDMDINGHHICPRCLETEKKQQRISDLDGHRTLYDAIALALAVWPMLIFFITCITAPLTLYLVARHWKTPSSLLPRTRVRFVLAALIAISQIGGWGFFACSMAIS
ncbi:MAG: hypothetical protein JJV98_14090 [Desulfosarcina sp.]|nr:hypothetical protein [Desulfobacterales bacterium]